MEEFLPGYDWEEGEDPEEVAYVSVQVPSSICGLLCEHFPNYIEDLMAPPSEGKAKAIALAGNVCVLYDIDPMPLRFQ
jgi:hypothetical protein